MNRPGAPPGAAAAPAPDEETTRALLARAQAGDKSARDALVGAHLRLAHSVAMRFRGRGEDEDDLRQVAAIGLLKAIQRFDLARPARFSTYAVPLIIGELKMHLRSQGPLKVSRTLKSRASAVLACEEQLAQRLGRRPSLGEVATEIGLAVDEVVAALDSAREPVSVEALAEERGSARGHGRGNAPEWPAQAGDFGQAEILSSRLDRLALTQALMSLDERERNLLALRFFAGKTQKEVALLFGVSQVQVSRIERAALLSLRSVLG